jgi:hypothetical protein
MEPFMKTQNLVSAALASLLLYGCNNSDNPKIQINTQPVAQDDSISTVTDTPVSSRFIAQDADGDSLSFSIETQPSSGVLTLSDNGNFTYTPNQEFTGNDNFIFRAFDGVTYSQSASISIVVERKQEVFSQYSRASFQQPPSNQPTGVNGRDFNQDVVSTDEYQDLVDNGEQ